MSELIRITLPLPPGVNNQYLTVHGRRVLSPQARRWKQQAQRILTELELPPAFAATAREGYLALFIDFFFETPLRRDLDGGLKIAQDVICQSLGIDDRRVVDIHLVKRIDPLHPRIEVELEALADWAFDADHPVL
ncbi:MAG: RusA family crossover junction endodeoxyribonuclease [Chloroflexota bacterium]|nr:RusA family crossover junction endodeoxyribonuclease [Chloroflexota bacterium]PLS79626.1 MAG: RusA family crossover junction endodeoxyribonuclease [Chloroflexota bacterium]